MTEPVTTAGGGCNDLEGLCLAALSSGDWRSTRDIVFGINGPRETTIPWGNLVAVLDRLAKRRRIERRKGRPRLKSIQQLESGGQGAPVYETQVFWRLKQDAARKAGGAR